MTGGGPPWRAALCAVAALFLTGAGPSGSVRDAVAQPVTVRGYAGDAMGPHIPRDARYLLFNNLNHPNVDTNLHYAERIDGATFQYRGQIEGANTPALEGTPTTDRQGDIYFVSTRSYL